MDIDLNSNGNSKQVGNLTVLIGSDPFLPQPDSTPSSSLDKDPPLTDLGPIDPDIFASPPPKRRKRK